MFSINHQLYLISFPFIVSSDRYIAKYFFNTFLFLCFLLPKGVIGPFGFPGSAGKDGLRGIPGRPGEKGNKGRDRRANLFYFAKKQF